MTLLRQKMIECGLQKGFALYHLADGLPRVVQNIKIFWTTGKRFVQLIHGAIQVTIALNKGARPS